MKKNVVVVAFLSFLCGCASPPEKISTAYVSPTQYKDYNCQQISEEYKRVTRRANDLHLSLQKTADDDAMQMGVGLVLFWPTLFFLEGGDGPEATEYSRLKGERAVLEQAGIQKSCALPPVEQRQPTPAPKPVI